MTTPEINLTNISREWSYMRTIDPQKYVCQFTNEKIELDGRLDKSVWEQAKWSQYFCDIQGYDKLFPVPRFKTRFKMLWDDEFLYIGIEMEEPAIWGTLTTKNSTMYHENDIEIFINPDGSHHNYYEFEANCLNTIWELLLKKPYKDGHSIINPHNLHGIRSSVLLRGEPNNPSRCPNNGWNIEVALPLEELRQFNRTNKKLISGDIWRMNFSRVEWKTKVIDNKYIKIPDTKEDNWVWSPTGVIDIHRPEMWGFVVFSRQTMPFPDLSVLLHYENTLNTVYYDQREYMKKFKRYASNLKELYPNNERSLNSEDIKIIVDTSNLTVYEASIVGEYEDKKRKWAIRNDSLLVREDIHTIQDHIKSFFSLVLK